MNLPTEVVLHQDLKALVEACVMDGFDFGRITKEIRTEWVFVGLRDAIDFAARALRELESDGGAIGACARRTLMEWNTAHPGVIV